jgi:hypothetical protein
VGFMRPVDSILRLLSIPIGELEVTGHRIDLECWLAYF